MPAVRPTPSDGPAAPIEQRRHFVRYLLGPLGDRVTAEDLDWLAEELARIQALGATLAAATG